MKTRKSVLASVVLVIAVLAFCLFLSVPAMAVSVVPLYSANDPLEIRVLAYTSTDILLLTTKTVAAGIVASTIIIAFATRNEIEKVISTVRRRLIFGHHPGPPRLAVWFLGLARALEGIVVYFADTFTHYNDMKVDTTTDGKFINNNPFSLGVMTNGHITT